ncbi:hypothetical protein AN958_00936 [Leucoagaricus sp. SymC.cos]|nr:hypothetical protein AN958_00936 [Leucoagaricus sp. SymC.cos]
MVVFSMGDATGETTGGISNVMTVGAPTAGTQSCNLTDPGVQFYYAADSALQQCKNYPFSLFVQSGAVLPISILVTVPNGESFILHPPNNNDPFNWQANLTAGTPVLFTMTDAQNRVGGTSSLVTVQSSDDSSCVHPLPSSAAPTRVPSPTGSAPATNTGLIVGVAVGAAIALLILIALIYFVAKRNGAQFGTKVKRIDLTEPGPDSSTYLLPGHSQQNNYPPLMPFPPYRDTSTPSVNPFQPTDPNRLSTTTTFNNGLSAPVTSMDATMNTSKASSSAYYPTTSGRQSAQPDSLSQSGVASSNFSSAVGPSTVSSGQSSSNKRLASNSTTIAPQRFIVHTDIEDEPIELPPMYSESRGPIPGIPASSTPQTGKGSTY